MAYFPDNDDGFTTLQALCLSEAATALSASQLLRWLPARSLSRPLAVRAFLIEQDVRSTRIDVRALGVASDTGPPGRVDLVYLER